MLGYEALNNWLGRPPKDLMAGMLAWVEVLQLIVKSKSAIGDADPQLGQPLANALERVWDRLKTYNVTRPIHEGFTNFPPADFEMVEMAGHILDRKGYEKQLFPEEIQQAKVELDGLHAEVEESGDLTPEAKAVARQIIEKLRTAFQNYKVSGADGIGDALAMSYGLWALHRGVLGSIKAESEDAPLKKVWRRIEAYQQIFSETKQGPTAERISDQFVDALL